MWIIIWSVMSNKLSCVWNAGRVVQPESPVTETSQTGYKKCNWVMVRLSLAHKTKAHVDQNPCRVLNGPHPRQPWADCKMTGLQMHEWITYSMHRSTCVVNQLQWAEVSKLKTAAVAVLHCAVFLRFHFDTRFTAGVLKNKKHWNVPKSYKYLVSTWTTELIGVWGKFVNTSAKIAFFFLWPRFFV